MGQYIQENLDGAAGVPIPDAGMDDCLSERIRAFSVIGLFKCYFKTGFKLGLIQSVEEAQNFLKEIVNEALNNGDMNQNDYECISGWLTEHKPILEGNQGEGGNDHFAGHVLEDLCVCDCPDTPEKEKFAAFKAAQEQYRKLLCELVQSYGTLIASHAQEFLRLYGAKFNSAIREKMCI